MTSKEGPPFDLTGYWNKRYEFVDVTASGHIDLPAEYNTWLYRRKQDHLASAVARVGGSFHGSKLFEVAAGSGAWMNFWDSQGVREYFGIDLSERAINDLTRRFPRHRFVQRDLSDPALAATVGTGYDCVTAMDVLYHVTDDDRFAAGVKELVSLLKPGGLLVIHDQFLHGPAAHHGYIRWRSLSQYEEVLDWAGVDIVYRRPTFFFMIQTVDFTGLAARIMSALWARFSEPAIARFPRFAGAIGYVVDTAICAVLHEGPSMEVMVCRKRG